MKTPGKQLSESFTMCCGNLKVKLDSMVSMSLYVYTK